VSDVPWRSSDAVGFPLHRDSAMVPAPAASGGPLPEFPEMLSRAERSAAEGLGRKWNVGVALSGGGIRSATFCLGFFQGLARHQLLPCVDYLSTVSGGGYFGSFLGRLFCRPEVAELSGAAAAPTAPGEGATPPPAGTDRSGPVADVLTNPGSAPLRFLRDNGRYLAPQGMGDLLRSAVVALRNFASVQVVVILTLLAALSLLESVAYSVLPLLQKTPLEGALTGATLGFWIHPSILVLWAALAIVALATGWAYWLIPESSMRGLRSGWGRALAVIGIGLYALWSANRGIDPALMNTVAMVSATTLVLFLVSSLRLGVRTLLHHPPGRLVSSLAATLEQPRSGFTRVLARLLGTPVSRSAAVHELRNRYTHALTLLVQALLAVGLLGAIDAGATVLARQGQLGNLLTAFYGAAAAVIAALRPGLLKLVKNDKRVGTRWLAVGLAAGTIAAVLALGALTLLDVVPVRWAWGAAAVPTALRQGASDAPVSLRVLYERTALLIVLSVLAGRTRVFVNRSSLYAVYESALRRCFLGASNPERLASIPLARSHRGDGIEWHDYHPERYGGPVHIINATINETVDSRTEVDARDRKGLPMAIGPGGVSVGRHHHAVWRRAVPPDSAAARSRGSRPSVLQRAERWSREVLGLPPEAGESPGQFQVFPGPFDCESLDLSHWVAISAAAFSTGLGSRTSLGFSLLAGMANVRLGYWWHSGIKRSDRSGTAPTGWRRGVGLRARSALQVQGALADEWLARFPGIALENWYLTDGGHFENTAVYELIRRRLPFIIVCDCGTDPQFGFADLGNLVRKARIDFGADIHFLERHELGGLSPGLKGQIGTLEDLRLPAGEDGKPAAAAAHAAVATIEYRADAEGQRASGMILWVKPTLTGDEPADVQEYHTAQGDFPQQSTLDQFFDEAQWESYRALGDHVATVLFEEREAAAGWDPRRMLRQLRGLEAEPAAMIVRDGSRQG
jgi:hypothetical protein